MFLSVMVGVVWCVAVGVRFYHLRPLLGDTVTQMDRHLAQTIVHRWDADAAVYVTAGQDREPGVAGVDDDGSAVVDDRSELGATGSDDVVLTPDDPGYDAASSGAVEAILLSRGAMRRTDLKGDDDLGPGHYRIDKLNRDGTFSSRFLDIVEDRSADPVL